MKRIFIKWVKAIISLCLISIFFYLSKSFFDFDSTKETIMKMGQRPFSLATIFVGYGVAFLFRAIAWQRYLLKKATIKNCFNGIIYSLLVNHISPIKVGDLVRVGFLVMKEELKWDDVFHSVIIMRLIDMITLITFSLLGLWLVVNNNPFSINISPWLYFILVLSALVVCIIFRQKKSVILRHVYILKTALIGVNGLIIIICIVASWLFEGIVVFEIAKLFPGLLSFTQSVWVNSVTVAGQVFQVTPGGIATYESVMSLALTMFMIPPEVAYQISIFSHGFKFLFSYVLGIYVLIYAPIKYRLIKSWLLRGRR